MEQDKRVIAVENAQSLARVGVQIGLVGKVLSAREEAFLKPRQVVLRCETVEGFKEFIVDSNITEFELYEKNITQLPSEIGQLKSLIDLDLRCNYLTSLPIEIWQLKNLKELRLSYNRLTSLPAEIGNLNKLTDLTLGENQLTHLPAEIGNLTNLTELNLCNNQLTIIEIQKIKALLTKCSIQFHNP